MKCLIFISFLLYVALGSCNSSSGSLKNTKWKLLEAALDRENTYKDESKLAILLFDTPSHVFSFYRTSTLITYSSDDSDTVSYKQKGDLIFYNDDNNEMHATRILKLTRDTLVIKTPGGATYKMIKVDEIPEGLLPGK